MLAEVLLVLSGHPSSFFTFHPPAPLSANAATQTLILSPSLSTHLHPGEVASLNTLSRLAHRYTTIRRWARDVQDRARRGVLEAALSRRSGAMGIGMGKGKSREMGDGANADAEAEAPDVYMSTLVETLLGVLGEYELALVRFEADVLSLDPGSGSGSGSGVVQDVKGFVPLASVVAAFDEWQPVMAALEELVACLSRPPPEDKAGQGHAAVAKWTPGLLIAHLTALSRTGHPRLGLIYRTLLSSLVHLFLTHLSAFLLFGLAPPRSARATSTSQMRSAHASLGPITSLGVDLGLDPLSPAHRLYALDEALIPREVGRGVRESVLYVGRVAAILRAEGRGLPREMIRGLEREIGAVRGLGEGEGLERAVRRARAEVGEWLWKNVLTGRQITEAIQSFGHYFLLRRADYALSLIRELHRLRLARLITPKPHSSTSVIRAADLDVALLRASMGTSAEDDAQLERLAWVLPNGPLRPIASPSGTTTTPRRAPRSAGTDTAAADQANMHAQAQALGMFSPSVLGAPLELRARVSWPLDLFMTPASVGAYTEIHAYLFALRDAHTRVLDAWTAMSAAQRRRRNGAGSGGSTGGGSHAQAIALGRTAWGTVRAMLFFLDQLQGHFMSDIIHVQHRALLHELRDAGAGGSGSDDAARTGSRLAKSASGTGPGKVGPASAPLSALTGSQRSTTGTGTGTGAGRSWSRSSLRDLHSGTGSPQPDSPGSETDAGSVAGTVRSRGRPPTPGIPQDTYLDFLTLRQMHTRHLHLLREGLLLTDVPILGIIRDILDACKRLAGLVERWGGDIIPVSSTPASAPETAQAQAQDVGDEVRERLGLAREIKQMTHELLSDFYRALLETQTPGGAGAGRDDVSSAGTATTTATGTTLASRTAAARTMHMSRLMGRQASFTLAGAGAGAGAGGKRAGAAADKGKRGENGEKTAEAEAQLGRHVEQLLLRLDFNGVLSEWIAQEDEGVKTRDLLGEGGL